MGMSFEIPDSILKLMPGGKNPFAPTPGSGNNGPVIGETKTLVPGAAGTTAEIARLGIPATVVADGPAGLRISPKRKGDTNTYYCTAFPVGTLLASTWDKDLIFKVGQAYGNEVLEYGVDVLLGPGMNIHRNPLCGRNFEYYSEDPLVSGKIAAAMVNGIESQGVGTSIKHFAANNQETNRNSVNTVVSERALREIYLEGFRIAVEESQPWTVMSSYNLINGTFSSENYDLLTKVLRDDWKFRGIVMTDWFGGKDAVAQMKAGNDLLMPGPNQVKDIINAVKEGKLDEKVLDKNVDRILQYIVQTPRFKGYQFTNKPDLKAHALVTREVATEGMVLLKNEKSALPFTKNTKKIATFGTTSFEMVIGGTGSGDVNEAYTISLVTGLTNAGYTVNETLKNTYIDYIKTTKANRPKPKNPIAMMMGGMEPVPEMNVDGALVSKMAEENDAAVITIGRNSGEGSDRTVDDNFNLSATEKAMVKNIADAFHAKGKKVIVVLNIGGVIETASWRNMPDAILLAWQPGQEAGNSIADVLSGASSPSGKLATTFPMTYADVPSSTNFPGIELPTDPKDNAGGMSFMRGKPAKVVYEEGIYVGYRYYTTFKKETAYEFGYGLSYTNFTYSNLKLSSTKFSDKISVSVDVKNTGAQAGKEIAQLYLSAPAKKLDKPERELKAFAKTKLLKPGESETLTFVLTAKELASFDPAVSSWVADAGKYSVKIGASSKDIKQTASFELAKDITVLNVSKALVPVEKINELKPKI
jgi:beta-glucosidase